MVESKSFAFPLCCSLLLFAIFPTSHASILRSSDDGVPPQELWCVAKNNAEDSALQAALDWACRTGGADCNPIQQGGPCYDASSVQNTASFAFNDYFLKHGFTNGSCYFDNSAAVTSLNPSYNNCKFPSSLTVSNGSFSGSTSSLGLGPSEDINGCNRFAAWRWLWPLVTIHLLVLVAQAVSVL